MGIKFYYDLQDMPEFKKRNYNPKEIFKFGILTQYGDLSNGSRWHHNQISTGRKQAALAQWLAHLTCNEKVTRSTRVRGRSF